MAQLHLHIERPGDATVDRVFATDVLTIGRSEQSDLVVNFHKVSRQHARLFLSGNDWFVEDMKSRNGTRLNGQPVEGPRRLRAGDTVEVGDTRLVFGTPDERAKAASPQPTFLDSPGGETMLAVMRPAAGSLHHAVGEDVAARRLHLMNEVHRALATPISRADLLDLILDRAFAVLKPEDAAIFLRVDGGELYRAAERRSPASPGNLLVSRRLADEVTVKGVAALVVDAQTDSRFAGAESILVSGVRSILAAPLSDSEGCLGMIALYSRMHVRRFEEADLELLVSVASAAALRIRNISLVEQAAARQVVDRELALAREIQMGMLLHRAPDVAEVDVDAQLRPARSVGGDLYDFVVDGRRLWFIVADVAGKGIGAALLMAVARTLFRATAPMGLPLPDVMGHINRELCRDNDRAVFVTAWAGCLDLDSGRLEVANAGHNPPFWLGRDGSVRPLTATNSVAFGVLEDARFPVTSYRLEPGDGLFIYTDGVTDAVDTHGAGYGVDAVQRCLMSLVQRPAADTVKGVFDAVDAFAGTAPQEDDITVLALRYRGLRRHA